MYPTSGEIKSHNVDNVYVIYYFIEKYIKSRESIITYSIMVFGMRMECAKCNCTR